MEHPQYKFRPIDLRVGNYVLVNREIHRISNFSELGKFLDFSQIKIDDKILVLSGFNRYEFENEDEDARYYWVNKILLYQFNDGRLYLGSSDVQIEAFPMLNTILIRYVHQLQNLFYELTGEELDLSL